MPERCPCPAPRRHPASGRKKGSGQSGGQPRHFRALSEELRGPSGTPAGGHLDAHPRRPAPPALPANPSRDGGASACHCCSLRSQFWHFKKLGIAQSIIRLSAYLPIYLSTCPSRVETLGLTVASAHGSGSLSTLLFSKGEGQKETQRPGLLAAVSGPPHSEKETEIPAPRECWRWGSWGTSPPTCSPQRRKSGL